MSGLSEREKMLAGQLYLAADSELVAMRRRARRLTGLYTRRPKRRRQGDWISSGTYLAELDGRPKSSRLSSAITAATSTPAMVYT
jgi:Maltose acetyltransferase hexapeptide capping motif